MGVRRVGAMVMGVRRVGLRGMTVVMIDDVSVQRESLQPFPFQQMRRGLSLRSLAMETAKHRAGERFLNQDDKHVVGRQKRELMAKMRERRRATGTVLKKPVAVRPVPRPGNRHRRYPCCGRRKERCACDWSGVEARLDPAAWDMFLGRLQRAELKFAGASVDQHDYISILFIKNAANA